MQATSHRKCFLLSEAECHINNLLTELARTVLGNNGRTATTSGQYSPVRPSHSISKRLILWLKSCKVLIYVLFFMSSTKKSPFLAVSTWLLVPGKIQDRRQDGDLCWWRHRPPAAPPSIKYTFSCWEVQRIPPLYHGGVWICVYVRGLNSDYWFDWPTKVSMLLVVFQFSRDVIGHEDSNWRDTTTFDSEDNYRTGCRNERDRETVSNNIQALARIIILLLLMKWLLSF